MVSNVYPLLDPYHYHNSPGLSPTLTGDSHLSLERPYRNDQLPGVNTSAAPAAAQSTIPLLRQTSPVSSSDSTTAQEPPTSNGPSQPKKASNKQPLSAEEAAADKRRRNTLAARRFRQKQQDRVAQLEQALKEVSKERDELKMQVARWEGETVALRAMLAERSKKG